MEEDLTGRLLSELLDSDPTGAPRAYVERVREDLFQAHRAGAGGEQVVSAYTAAVDHLIRSLYDAASRDYVGRYPTLSHRCAVLAQGGYGRGELNPQSDIDLLFIHVWKITPFVESVAERILYALWDSGLQVGHAIRSIAESIRLGNRDMKVKTSMIDARFIIGEHRLYEDLTKTMSESFTGAAGDRFVRSKIEENRARHERYGASVYLSEPEIKEGQGGLRDIHTLLWIAKARWGVNGLDDVSARGVLTVKDLNALKAARDFLLRVRNEVHFISPSHQDQLTFEQQEIVAMHLGFEGDGKIKAVEAFMRAYYLHATQISRVASLVLHRAVENPELDGLKTQKIGRETRPGVLFARGVLTITRPEPLTSDPESIMTVFLDAQRFHAEIDQETRELLRDRVDLIDESFRNSKVTNGAFLEIVRGEEWVHETLIEMHRCGVLDAFLPEFGRVLCMAQHDLYHIYTVDQHSLKAVREFERLRSGEFREELPLLTQLARDVDRIGVQRLGILFHDIGKGQGGNHSEIGSRMADEIATRLRLNIDEREHLVFLVLQHLIFSHTSFRRDIDDDDEILGFAQLVGSLSTLKMLYLLTAADIRAVAPGVWNNWKASLLEDLYVRTARVLEEMEKGGFRKPDSRSKVRRIQTRLRGALRGQIAEDDLHRLLDGMPDRYFLTTPEAEMPFHFKLMDQYAHHAVISSVRHFPEREYTEIAVCAKDQPGFFARVTGVFASMGLDILGARINTRKDGVILDVFRISHLGRPEVVMDEGRWVRVQNALERVMTEDVDIAGLVENSGQGLLFKSRQAPRVPTVVHFDNNASEDFSIVEVYTQDRVGVLFSIAHTLYELGLSIHLAKISTNVDQVADVFYVTDEQGNKVNDQDRLELIRQSLFRELVRDDEGLAQPTG